MTFNGSGSATILEIAEQLAKLKYIKKLQRQVRFAFWGAEELNLLGSTHYVDSLTQAQQDKICANLNFDMVGLAQLCPVRLRRRRLS